MLKCINAERDPASHERLLAAAREHPDVHVIDRYMTPSDKNALTATCDCYVSLHRSEGFGLTMAEAMYVGKPVIATGYSGNLDFMTAENGLLVDYELRADRSRRAALSRRRRVGRSKRRASPRR